MVVLPLRYDRSSPELQSGAVTRPAREAALLVPPASIRTGDIPLTGRALCQLSYAGRDGKRGALPAELTEHGRRGRSRTCTSMIKSHVLCLLSYAPEKMATLAGFEPAASRSTGEHSAPELQRRELAPLEGLLTLDLAVRCRALSSLSYRGIDG